MTRSFLRVVARVLAGVVLMAQMAISAYACPALLLHPAASLQGPPANPSPDNQGSVDARLLAARTNHCDDMAAGMDASSANLCAEHCKYGQQSNQAATLNAPTAVLVALYATPLAPEPVTAPRPTAAATSALLAAAPPSALLHCCLRI